MKVMAAPAFCNRAFNPYTNLLYEAMQKRGVEVFEFSRWRIFFRRYDILHLHWPEYAVDHPLWPWALVKGSLMLFLLAVARARGVRIVWTAHNLRSHARLNPRLEDLYFWLLHRQLDGIISLTQTGLVQLTPEIKNLDLPTARIPHGHYRAAYPNRSSRAEVRTYLGLPATALVIGWMGQIRPYKGVPELVAAFRADPDPEKILLLAGTGDESLIQLIREAAASDPRIHFHEGHVAEDHFHYFLNAADLIILPFRRMLNSGSVVLALSFDRPVVVPRLESLSEIEKQIGPNWVHFYEGTFDTAALNEACRWWQECPRPASAPLESLEWDRLAAQTVDFFQGLLDRK